MFCETWKEFCVFTWTTQFLVDRGPLFSKALSNLRHRFRFLSWQVGEGMFCGSKCVHIPPSHLDWTTRPGRHHRGPFLALFSGPPRIRRGQHPGLQDHTPVHMPCRPPSDRTVHKPRRLPGRAVGKETPGEPKVPGPRDLSWSHIQDFAGLNTHTNRQCTRGHTFGRQEELGVGPRQTLQLLALAFSWWWWLTVPSLLKVVVVLVLCCRWWLPLSSLGGGFSKRTWVA